MKLKNNLFRSTAAIIAALFALSFTGCGQSPIISESPSSTGVVSESTASSEQTAGGSVDGSFTIHFFRRRTGGFRSCYLRRPLNAY